MVRIALIALIVALSSPLVTEAWLWPWGSKKEEPTGPIETVVFRVGNGRIHRHHSEKPLYQFIKRELAEGKWDPRIGVKWITPNKGYTRPELYSFDAHGKQVGKPVDVEFFSTDQIEKLLIGKGFDRLTAAKRVKEEL